MKFVDKTRDDLAIIIGNDLGSWVNPANLNEQLIHWLEFGNRRLPAARWHVKKSREVLANPYTKQYFAGLHVIERNFENGISNSLHQSRETKKANYNDLLFNDWGMHHFHLSNTYEADGYCTRTEPILFTYFHGDTVYFIDILKHGKAHRDVWAHNQLTQVMMFNWPEVVNNFELKGIIPPQKDWSPQERIELRKKGITSPVNVNGRVYAPFGLGVNTAKGSTRFSLQAVGMLKDLQNSIAALMLTGDVEGSDGVSLSDILPAEFSLGSASVTLRLRVSDARLEVYEEATDKSILWSRKIVDSAG